MCHQVHESARRSGHAFRHDHQLEESVLRLEGGLPLIFGLDPDLVVAILQVDL